MKILFLKKAHLVTLPLIKSVTPYQFRTLKAKRLCKEKPSRKEFNEKAREYFEKMIRNYAGRIVITNFGFVNYQENHNEVCNNLRVLLEYALRNCDRKTDTIENVEIYFATSVKNYRIGLKRLVARERYHFTSFDHPPGEGQLEESFQPDESNYPGVSIDTQNEVEYKLLRDDIKKQLRDDFDRRIFELMTNPPPGLKDIRSKKHSAFRHREWYSYKKMYKLIKEEFPLYNLVWHNHGEYQIRSRPTEIKDVSAAIARIKDVVRKNFGLKKVRIGQMGATREQAIESWKTRKKYYGFSGFNKKRRKLIKGEEIHEQRTI